MSIDISWVEIPKSRNDLDFFLCCLVLETGPGNRPAVWIWTAQLDRFGSRPVQNPNQLTLGGNTPDPYPSTCGFHRVWVDPLVPIPGFAFWASRLQSHSDMLLLIVPNWHWYITVHFWWISRLDVQNNHTHTPNHILKMSVNRGSTIVGLAFSIIWVVLDHKHP